MIDSANGNGHVSAGLATELLERHDASDPYFAERGFPAELVGELGWRVEPLGDRTRRYGLPPEATTARAWLIPYRHENGRVAFERIRLIDDVDLERFGGGKYRQPAGRAVGLYDPFGVLTVDAPVESIMLCEGEANTVALHLIDSTLLVIGFPGQGTLSDELAHELGHVPVVYLSIDADDPGAERNAARTTECLLAAGVDEVRLLEWTRGIDANDLLRALGAERARDELAAKLERAVPVTPPSAAPDAPSNESGWPSPPRAGAFHGLAGAIVDTIAPHSEADPAALLLQFLVAFGNVVGPGPGFRVEADQHGVNLFAVLVGKSSKARKGTSWGWIRELFRLVDSSWLEQRKQSGVSSGEGLIHAVRDATIKRVRDKQTGDFVDEVDEPGVDDKRFLAQESEFASVLQVMGRDGNTLSVLLRQAWDGDTLQTLTKNSPAKATGAHISIVAHITCEELRRKLDATETANGFANRFAYACIGRSKLLPEGGNLRSEDLAELAERVRECVRAASAVEAMRRDADARARWRAVYGDLSEGKPGLLGAVTSRAEAQVMRLACIYALLDLSRIIRVEHLEAALALWDYLEASARYVFGDALGNPVADELLEALRSKPRGLTRTELRDHLGRHHSGKLEKALRLLEERRLAYRVKEPSGGGRPIERWIAR